MSVSLNATRERPVASYSGYAALIALLVAIAVEIYAVAALSTEDEIIGAPMMVLGTLAILLLLPGFYLIQPNQAAAILLFGE